MQMRPIVTLPALSGPRAGSYAAGEDGRIYRVDVEPARVRVGSPHWKHGYLWLTFGRRARIRRPVHRLVLEAWVGPCPPGMEARHLNGDRQDNRPVNLLWGTRSENHRDMIRHGRKPLPRNHARGEAHYRAKLTEAQVLEIRQSQLTASELARRYGVARTTVKNVKRRHIWKWLP